MQDSERSDGEFVDLRDVAEQARVELAILMSIEEALRLALQWMTRDRGNSRKLSTLRFQAWSFERQLARVHMLADHDGYLDRITAASPHLAQDVETLRAERGTLHRELECLVARLDCLSHHEADAFAGACHDLTRLLDKLRAHGHTEAELLQQCFVQDEGGSG